MLNEKFNNKDLSQQKNKVFYKLDIKYLKSIHKIFIKKSSLIVAKKLYKALFLESNLKPYCHIVAHYILGNNLNL